MAEILLDPSQIGDGLSYIRALTKADKDIPFPPAFPADRTIGASRWARVNLQSLSVAASLGFSSFASGSTDVSTQVLVRDYLYSTEIEMASNYLPIRSFSYGAGFRVALAVSNIDVKAGASFSVIAAQAQVNNKQVAVDVKVIGMPLGPGVPSVLVDGLDFNVESYRQLQNFVDATQQYLIDHPKDIQPQPISAALNELDGQALLDMNPGVRFAMWRILSGATLTDALALTKNHADVDPIVVRTVYATVLNQPALLRAGSSGLENQHPDPPSQGKASQWINMFRLG